MQLRISLPTRRPAPLIEVLFRNRSVNSSEWFGSTYRNSSIFTWVRQTRKNCLPKERKLYAQLQVILQKRGLSAGSSGRMAGAIALKSRKEAEEMP
jgi:hypothetical protein